MVLRDTVETACGCSRGNDFPNDFIQSRRVDECVVKQSAHMNCGYEGVETLFPTT